VTADRRSPASRPAADPADPADRTDDDRLADHAAIDRLADELVPALIAKLSASGLGEIEVGEGSWTVRVRRPAEGAASSTRRSGDRGTRAQPGQAGHGHAPGGFESHRTARESRPIAAASAGSSNGSGPAGNLPAGPAGRGGTQDGSDAHRRIATSPAVGIFQPRAEARAGTRVRSGDRLGAVDLLGVPQEVVAPADGIVGASLVEPGEAVEYGQELIVIELAARGGEAARAGADGGDRSEG
jgi:biotin carboxyl carrier protein